MSDESIHPLVDRQAVIDACYAYAAGVDNSAREQTEESFAAYADTMTPDCIVDYGPLGRFESRDEWIEFAHGVAAGAGLCQHLYANFVVEIDGDVARARFNAQALHFWSDQPVGAQLLTAAAEFDNALRRTPDGWKLTRVQPNIQFVHDPGANAAKMFPGAGG
jgi:hypothetical protein